MTANVPLRVLADITKNAVAERYKRLEFSADRGTNLKEEILARRWVKQGRVRIGRRQFVVRTLTTAGLRVLRESGSQGEYATHDEHARTEQ